MKVKKTTTVYLVQAAMIAAIYAALTLFLEPISFSGNQFRVSEALTLLPVLTSAAIPGLTIGCLIANISSPYFVVDMICGSLATLGAAVCTRKARNIRFKNLPVLSAVFPVIFNGVIVGAEISALATGGFTWQLFLVSGASVALSETVVCFLLGLPLCAGLEKLHVFENGRVLK